MFFSCGVEIGEALRSDEAWKGNIHMNLKERFVYVARIYLTDDTDQRMGVVETVPKLWLP